MIGSATWTIAGGRVLGPAPFLLAGIVNATPDSFYDGGRHNAPAAAVSQGRKLLDEGAHLLDVGGESTRPGAPQVSEAEELERVVPVIRELSQLSPRDMDGLPGPFPVLAVDTYKARVAVAALEAGALVVNDVSACRFDPALLDVVGQMKPGYVLMHSQGEPRTMQNDPRYGDVVDDICAFFEERLGVLTGAGLPEANIVLDPGIGFGKLLEHNLAILRGIERFGKFGRPVYMGLSNKTLWGTLLGLGPQERQQATATATGLLVARGVLVHRVHEVALSRQAARIAAAIS
ncbi:MAG TPA: dihydropteroate synthase [Humidesulfovibrio sp.]|uniref:dihydropteroate synthase n=1 Tax=Humidesulfovibrio sp. TaxID=2910988 RepID=UPI002C8E744F|nr:dihydropteroate synthase [Humidesulfovibrio sp.]HWR04599.1 dihydropteroate synthase [Humidesulfovibrio sp.]